MHTQYSDKIISLKHQENKLRKLSKTYLYAKLIFFALMITSAYMTINQPSNTNIAAIVLFLIAYFVSYILDDKCKKRIDAIRNMQKVCENEIRYLKGDFTAFNSGTEYIDSNHEFSYDLDIFGPSSLFNRINRTITQEGSNKLAKKFTTINQNKDDIDNNQKAIVELSKQFDWRIKFLSHHQIQTNLGLLSDYIFKNKNNRMLESSILPYISIVLTITALVLNIFNVFPFLWFVAMFLIQLFITITVSKVSTKTSSNTEQLYKEYKGILVLLKDIHQLEFQSSVLVDLKKELFNPKVNSLESFTRLSKILSLFDQRSNAILYLLLNGVLLYDILLIRMFRKWGNKYLSHVGDWINCIAEIDALVSLATYSFNNPSNTLAQVIDYESDDIIQAVNFYHPFLSHEKAVSNSFTLKRSNIAIVTGANMAGKSTFLRTIGVTYILASNGVPVCAESFKFSPVSLFSSMRTSDNLSQDISYFNAELIRLEQLIKHVKSHDFTLIILDEILKGTNSKDKLKGSTMFLDAISKYPISAVIATHDLELAKLEDKDNSIYSNYCFEINLSDEITYTYKIQQGVAQNLNASYLLSNILKDLQ